MDILFRLEHELFLASLALRLGIRDDFEGLLLRRADLRLRGTLSRHIAGGTADNHCNDYR